MTKPRTDLLHAMAWGQPQSGRPALLLLHGFCEDHSVWAPVVERLAARGTAHGLSVDLPGFGQTPRLAGEPAIGDYASALQRTLGQIGVGPHVAVGHSMGGYVALAYARMRPEGLQGLCLFHSTAAPDSPEKQEQRLKSAAFVREHGAAAFAKPLLQGLFAPSRAAEHAEALAQLQAKAALLEPEAIAQALLAMRGRPDARPWLREAALPIAFAAGGQDPVLPIGPLREQAALPREVRWHEWPEAGHMGMIECPDEAADLLEALVA